MKSRLLAAWFGLYEGRARAEPIHRISGGYRVGEWSPSVDAASYRAAVERVRVETYSRAGCLIHQHILTRKDRADYGDQVMARWYDPRNGRTTGVGTVERSARVSFDPPGRPHFANDWVLVLRPN